MNNEDETNADDNRGVHSSNIMPICLTNKGKKNKKKEELSLSKLLTNNNEKVTNKIC